MFLIHQELQDPTLAPDSFKKFSFPGLKYLPSLTPECTLKKLDASNCGINKIHESFLKTGIQADLSNNQISDLPREEMLKFLENDGKLDYGIRDIRGIVIRFYGNPLVYPPKHIFEEGKDSVLRYLTDNLNSMVNLDDISTILIGNQEAGKTSLGLTLAGKITDASDIKPEDRTHAFDVYQTVIDGIDFTMIDLGGHREYESSLSLLARENGLHICVLNVSDFESIDRLYSAAWSWVEKVLDGAVAPHIIFVISKIDLIEKSRREEKKAELTKALAAYLQPRVERLIEIRKKRQKQLQTDVDKVTKEIEQNKVKLKKKMLEEEIVVLKEEISVLEHEKKVGVVATKLESMKNELEQKKKELESMKNELEQKKKELDPNKDDEEKGNKALPEQRKKLEEEIAALNGEIPVLEHKKEKLEDKLRRQIFKVNHPINLNIDCISVISTITKEGVRNFEKNLNTAIERLPPVKVQLEWMDTIELIFKKYQNRKYIIFKDLLVESNMKEENLIDLLKALAAKGRIVWSNTAGRRDIIYHRLEILSLMMKSVFYHEMEDILLIFARLTNVEVRVLRERYKQGQLPLILIRSMLNHIETHSSGDVKTFKLDYSSLQLSIEESELTKTFFSMLEKLHLLIVLTESLNGMEMCFIPHLVFGKLADLDQNQWIAKYIQQSTPFELGIHVNFETVICKNRFSKWCVIVAQTLRLLSPMMQAELVYHAQERALVIQVDHYQVVLQCKIYDSEKKALLLAVKLNRHDIMPETVWILLNELTSKLDLDEDSCHLVCPFPFINKKGTLMKKECDHGEYYSEATEHRRSLESIQTASNKVQERERKKIICYQSRVLKFCFPTQLAIDIMNCLHPSDGTSLSPLDATPPPHADYLESQNLISVTFSEPIPDPSKLTNLPIFNSISNLHKLNKFVQPVRQFFDEIKPCHQKEHEEGCSCYLPNYVKMFALLEENGLLVTKGEWKATLRDILEKYPNCVETFSEQSCSIVALVRVVRNIVAHRDHQDLSDVLFSEIRNAFTWLIMHCFSFWVLHIMPHEPTLSLFATDFQSYKKTYLIENQHTLRKPVHALFYVSVSYKDGSEKETIIFHDPTKELKNFATEVKQTLVIPDYHKKIYAGTHQKTTPFPDVEIELRGHDSISSLDLDTMHSHAVKIVEITNVNIRVTVMLDIPEKEINLNANPDESFEHISSEILSKTGKELKLFWNKKEVKVDDKIGSFGYERLEIVALDPEDKKGMKDYFRDGQNTDSDDESTDDEDVGDIMEGLGLFD